MGAEEKTIQESPLQREGEALGASFGEWFGCRLPSRYGEAAAEWAAARQGVALMDTNFRGFLSLAGPDRARYLNAVTTADIKNLQEGEGNVGLLLNPQGHILAEIETYAWKDELLLVTNLPFSLARRRRSSVSSSWTTARSLMCPRNSQRWASRAPRRARWSRACVAWQAIPCPLPSGHMPRCGFRVSPAAWCAIPFTRRPGAKPASKSSPRPATSGRFGRRWPKPPAR